MEFVLGDQGEAGTKPGQDTLPCRVHSLPTSTLRQRQLRYNNISSVPIFGAWEETSDQSQVQKATGKELSQNPHMRAVAPANHQLSYHQQLNEIRLSKALLVKKEQGIIEWR